MYEKFLSTMIAVMFIAIMACVVWAVVLVHVICAPDVVWYWKLICYQLSGMAIWKLPKLFLDLVKELFDMAYAERSNNE
jgi:hypothetical protein